MNCTNEELGNCMSYFLTIYTYTDASKEKTKDSHAVKPKSNLNLSASPPHCSFCVYLPGWPLVAFELKFLYDLEASV